MKKILSLFLAVLLLFSLISCTKEKNRSYDKSEVEAAARDLIERSEILNEIFWGDGISYIEDDNYRNGQYYPADPLYLKRIDVESITDLIALTGSVFSLDYTESICESTMASSVGNYGMAVYVRYYQGEDHIMVYTACKPLLTDKVEYDLSSVTATGSKGERVYVNLSVNVTRDDTSQTREIKVALIEEENGWRIDSPTYVAFDEYLSAK